MEVRVVVTICFRLNIDFFVSRFMLAFVVFNAASSTLVLLFFPETKGQSFAVLFSLLDLITLGYR
jgi:hypothetical protein